MRPKGGAMADNALLAVCIVALCALHAVWTICRTKIEIEKIRRVK